MGLMMVNEHKNKIIEAIGEKRYEHSIRVMETAIDLARKYNVDVKKAKLAGYYHDCAKYQDESILLKRAGHFDIIKDNIMRDNIELVHAPLGRKVAEEDYGIEDEEVLRAIEYHTTGNNNMSDLEKIIYLADYIEPYRNFPGVETVRELAFENLDKAMLYALDNTIKFLMIKGKLISIITIEARNEILGRLN